MILWRRMQTEQRTALTLFLLQDAFDSNVCFCSIDEVTGLLCCFSLDLIAFCVIDNHRSLHFEVLSSCRLECTKGAPKFRVVVENTHFLHKFWCAMHFAQNSGPCPMHCHSSSIWFFVQQVTLAPFLSCQTCCHFGHSLFMVQTNKQTIRSTDMDACPTWRVFVFNDKTSVDDNAMHEFQTLTFMSNIAWSWCTMTTDF